MASPTIAAPREGYTRTRATKSQFELIAWLFMRLSGVALVVLIFVHLWVNIVDGDGVKQIDFGFVAGKLASPFWQFWDLAMLWLAMLHGTNGMRTIIADYAAKDRTRTILTVTLYVVAAVVVVLGTLVIFTFDPCPVTGDPSLVPGYCSAP